MKVTIFGGAGFVGRHLCEHLTELGADVAIIGPGDAAWRGRALGQVFYCAGVTADFQRRPYDTIDAHVGLLTDLLRQGGFDGLVYLSSTRVYAGGNATAEDAPLRVRPADPPDLYVLSKLLGEAACLAAGNPAIRIARLSNVLGPDPDSPNFVPALIRQALRHGRVRLQAAPESTKDYIGIETAVRALVHIATAGRHRLYNVATGRNIAHQRILDHVVRMTGCVVEVAEDAPVTRGKQIKIGRLAADLALPRLNLRRQIETMVGAARSALRE